MAMHDFYRGTSEILYKLAVMHLLTSPACSVTCEWPWVRLQVLKFLKLSEA